MQDEVVAGGAVGAVGLSPRQLAALQCMAEGLTQRAAGRRLGLAPATVRRHLAGARVALGAASLAQAVGLAVAAGLVRAGPGV